MDAVVTSTGVERVAAMLAARRGELAARSLGEIRGAIASYGAVDDPKMLADVTEHVAENHDALRASLLAGRPVTSEDLAFIRPHAALRARHGVSLVDFLHAFRIGHRVIWDALLKLADKDADARAEALTAAGLVMEFIDEASTHAAEAYLDAQQLLLAEGDRVRRDLLEDLLGGREPSPGPDRPPLTPPVCQPAELVIFDCDGVLIDSERLAVKVDVRMLRELGWPLSEAEVIERFVGRSDRDTQAAIEAHLRRRLPPDWGDQVEELYRRAFAEGLAPVAGVPEALDLITLQSCVASSGTHEHLRYALGLTGLYERFAGRIFSVEDVARGKPAPDLFLHAAARMSAKPSRCVVVEDSRPGVEAGRAAGMRILAFAGGLSPRELLDGADTIVFEDMRDLPTLLERCNGGSGVR
jgi:HAD superfamily hydrolase (TIGR01509 family)